MGVMGIWQWVIVLAIVLLLFGGRGKISSLMGDFGKGLKSFKTGLKDGDGDDDDTPSHGNKGALEDKPAAAVEIKVEDKEKSS